MRIFTAWLIVKHMNTLHTETYNGKRIQVAEVTTQLQFIGGSAPHTELKVLVNNSDVTSQVGYIGMGNDISQLVEMVRQHIDIGSV